MFLERLWSSLRLAGALPHLIRHRVDGDYTVADRVEESAELYGDNVFLRFLDRSLSYDEFNAEANRVAHWGRAQGLGQGDVVALLMENRPEYLTTWMGLSKLGVVSALINTNLIGKVLDHALATAECRHVIVGSELLDSLASASPEIAAGLQVWVRDDPDAASTAPHPAGARSHDEALAGESSENPDPSLRDGLETGDDLLYIYTSGTTGNPKAARFSHLRFLALGDLFGWALDLGEDDVEYLALPLYHTAGGVLVVSRALARGASIAIRRRFSASAFWDDVRKYEATVFQYIGEFCRYLIAQPRRDDDRDHQIRAASGNGLRPDIWPEFQERFGIPKIIEFYGATEGNAALVNFDGKVGAVGRYPFEALTNVRVIKYDVENGVHPRGPDGLCIKAADDEPGELVGRIGNDTRERFEGYTNDEATSSKILQDVFAKGDRYFRTGDLLSRDADGYYYFHDRIGDTFRWKGENVSTQEVQEVVGGFPGVDLVSVYGVKVEGTDGRAGMAAFPLSEGADFDGAAFYRFVSQGLPAYAAPVFVRTLAEPEVTGTFKLRKVELQKQGFDPAAISDPLFVRDERAQAYVPLGAEIFAEIQAGTRRV